jgi:hypothetical protein
MANFTWPTQASTAAPVKFINDGSLTDVSINTVTPANSTPLPVIQIDSSGNPVTPFDPSTIEGYLATIDTNVGTIAGDTATLAAVDYATQTTLASLEGKDFATQTTLASLEAKDFATNGEQITQTNVLYEISDQQASVVDLTNSSTTPLGIGGVFTGASIEVTNFSSISIAAFSDVSSASGGLSMQFSPDGVNWDHTHNFDVVGGVGVSYNQAAELRYFRIVYTNGAVAQSSFRLTTILKRTNTTPSKYSLAQAVNSYMMADLTKSVIWGLSTSGGGTYHTVKVNPSGSLTADVTGSTVAATQSGTWNITNITGTVSLPTGAATETTLASIDTKVVTTANGIKVDGSAVTQPVSAASLPLPTGAATETTLASVDTKIVTTVNGIKVDGSAVTQPVSAASLPLPTGAATLSEQQTQSSTLSTISGKLPATLGQTTKSGSLSVTVASDQVLDFKASGRSKVQQLFLDYSLSNVTTAAYTQLVASTSAIVSRIEIFDSSGEVMILAVGGAGAEVDQLYIFPGGNGVLDLAIPASSRISVKAKTATAIEGYLAINLYA